MRVLGPGHVFWMDGGTMRGFWAGEHAGGSFGSRAAWSRMNVVHRAGFGRSLVLRRDGAGGGLQMSVVFSAVRVRFRLVERGRVVGV
jgi:hypothetical protein